MKLSEMSTQKAAQKMCDIAIPMANIAQDEKTAEAMRAFPMEKIKDMPMINLIGKAIALIVPLALRDHFEDLCEIVAAMTDKTAETVKSQKIIDTVTDVKNIVDGDIVHFFTSAVTPKQEKS